jgi:hypothetical protein
MNLSALDYLLWAAGFIADAVLLAVLLYRRRWSVFPVFTSFIAFEITETVLTYFVLRSGASSLYDQIYWYTDAIDFLLQLGVIWEIVRIVLRPTGTWLQDARGHFLVWGAAGILFAAALPMLVSPPAGVWQWRLEIRLTLFSSLVVCELFAVLTRTSKSLGLGWRNHVMALGNGWTLWSVSASLTQGLQCFFGTHRYFRTLEEAMGVVSIAVTAYWIVQFWLDEPARQPISPEFQAYIEALHQRLKNDLDTVDVLK